MSACPVGKVPFATALEARQYARGDRGTLHAYLCSCGAFHQSTKSKAQVRATRRRRPVDVTGGKVSEAFQLNNPVQE